jgi:hypothetical protein
MKEGWRGRKMGRQKVKERLDRKTKEGQIGRQKEMGEGRERVCNARMNSFVFQVLYIRSVARYMRFPNLNLSVPDLV